MRQDQALLGELFNAFFYSLSSLSLLFMDYSVFMNFSFFIAPLNNKSLHAQLAGARENGDHHLVHGLAQWQPH